MPAIISDIAATQAGDSDSRGSDGWHDACRKVASDWLGWCRTSCLGAQAAQDPQPTVLVKLEYLSYAETKLILLASYTAMVLGAGGVLGLMLLKIEANLDLLKSDWLSIINIAICSISLALMLPISGWLLYNVARTWQQQWDGLRWRLVVSNFLLLIVMMALCALIIAPNVVLLGQPCWYLIDDLAPIVSNLSSCQYGAWNTAFAILVCQVHELNPVGRRWTGAMREVFRNTKRAAAAVVRFVGRVCNSRPAKGVATALDGEQRDVQVGGEKAGAGGAGASGGSARSDGATPGRDGGGAAAGMDVERGCARDGVARTATRGMAAGSQPLRRAPTVADGSLLYHLPVLLLWVAVTLLLVFSNLNLKHGQDGFVAAEDNDADDSEYAEVTLPTNWSLWDTNLNFIFWNDPKFTTADLMDILLPLDDGADPSWRDVAADPGTFIPRNVTIHTGDAQRPAFLHIWGPYEANSRVNQWALQDELMVGSARPSVVDMPAIVEESDWALTGVLLWLLVGVEAPYVQFCRGSAGYRSVEQALNWNQDALRARFGLSLCSSKPKPHFCDDFPKCPIDTAELKWTGFINGLLFCYLVLYLYYLSRANRLLRERPYIAHRLANVLLRLQMRETLMAFLYFFIAITALFYVNRDACTSAIIGNLGVSPLAFVGAVLAVVKCVYSCPLLRADEPRLMSHAELQQFAWREADAPALLAARGHPDQPLFVLETALKALYYSITVYRHDRVEPDQPFSLRCAMQLDDLQDYEVVEDPQAAFKMVAGYRSGKLVLAFRGTVSMQNVRTNALALLKRYDHMQGKYRWMRPYVHRGFLAHWCMVRDQVLALVRRVMQGHCGDKDRPLEVLVTGHSLGGALATLAAYDISCILRDEGGGLAGGAALCCYTFGAPRVGNHAFAALYKAAVCETWDVCNNNDVVPKMTKWMRVYKRSGQRLIINAAGDIICRPSFIELNVNQRTFKNSVADHYLASYCASFAAVVAAQLSPIKAIDNGHAGVMALAECSMGQQLLQQLLRLDIEEVQRSLSDESKGSERGLLRDAVEALRGMSATLCAGTVGAVLHEEDTPYGAVRAQARHMLRGGKSQDADITAGLATLPQLERASHQAVAVHVDGVAS